MSAIRLELQHICFLIYSLSNILLPKLSTCVDEIIGDCVGFDAIDPATDQIFFCIHQILQRNWECGETVHQLFVYSSRKFMVQLGGKYCTIFSVCFVYP
jgi:hypothetical protein